MSKCPVAIAACLGYVTVAYGRAHASPPRQWFCFHWDSLLLLETIPGFASLIANVAASTCTPRSRARSRRISFRCWTVG